MSKWVEIADSDSRYRIISNDWEISEPEAMAFVDEIAADIASLR